MSSFRIILASIAVLSCMSIADLHAQSAKENRGSHSYKNGIGIRAGRTSGLTFKHFLSNGNSFELIAGFWPNAVGITALYEKNTSAGLKGLNFYYGGGGHFTTGTNSPYYKRHDNREGPYSSRYGRDGFAAGLDGIAGLEYKFIPIPLALSVDIKPFVEVSNYGVIYTALDAGLGIKLAF